MQWQFFFFWIFQFKCKETEKETTYCKEWNMANGAKENECKQLARIF